MVNTEIRLIIFDAAKDGEAVYSQQKQDWELTFYLVTYYGSDPELLIVKFRPELKKVGKTTRSFRYDLNKIPYKKWSSHHGQQKSLKCSTWMQSQK